MSSTEAFNEYQRWRSFDLEDNDLSREICDLDSGDIYELFYRHLVFGTGGLRGIIGVGTNRMNIYTVMKATQGVANYIHENFDRSKWVVAISRDSRIKSDLFAKCTAEVFAANNINVKYYENISPVPTLSYAVRYLGCCIGIMVTASHNPSNYNGYKVYGEDGCQITTEAAKEIYSFIDKVDVLTGFKRVSFDEGFKQGIISYIPPIVIDSYIDEVKNQSLLGGQEIDKSFSIVYSPLNGTGLVPITRTLKELGYKNIIVVKEQEEPNGLFPTCPFPNPEIEETLSLGIDYCRKHNADLLLATDPDCDRVGVAVKNDKGNYELLSGNEVGLLLLDYVCSRRIDLGIMPQSPVMIKTIVTIDLAEAIAKSYGVEVINVLTGFKFIGEQIGLLEKKGRLSDYICGFEESYGFLTGTYVRDKDGVNGATMIVEMFAFYKSKGVSLLDRLNEIWKKYGYCLTSLHFFDFPGENGTKKMESIMDYLRNSSISIPGFELSKKLDYINGLNGLPKSNVIKLLGKNGSVVFRPSGTEPKLKLYLSIQASSKDEASILQKQYLDYIRKSIFQL